MYPLINGPAYFLFLCRLAGLGLGLADETLADETLTIAGFLVGAEVVTEVDSGPPPSVEIYWGRVSANGSSG